MNSSLTDFPVFRNCILFLREFSTPLVCFHIPPSLLSAHLLWHWIAVNPGDPRWLALSSGRSLTGCSAASQGHAASWYPQCHRPRPLRLLSMMLPFPVTVKWSVSALMFCLSSSSSIWFRLQCPFLPQFSLADRFFFSKKKYIYIYILSYWFPSPRLLWQLGIHVTFITKTILFDDCLWLEK